jgi:glycosyltransferase XagB
VPARHEDEVLAHTLDTLAAQQYPNFEIICIVGHDDPGTTEVARAAEQRHPNLIRVVVDHSWPKNKPKALNSALPHVTGDVVGVFDAEDVVAPKLLRAIDQTFRTDRADVVQGGVQLMNIHSSWWSLRNCLEYYFWFRSRLHYHADQDFIPLGGNTVFVRTNLLRVVDGWDPECLAEDAELGVRLSSMGAWVSVAYEPELATKEETPGSIRELVKQRTRWNQGFFQVLRKGEWRSLPSLRQRTLARYTLMTPFIQASAGLLVPASLIMIIFVSTPDVITLFAFLPLMLVVASVSVEAVALHYFGKDFEIKVRLRDYLRLVLGTIPYQWLLASAALRAVWREARDERGWEKTSHTGAHITTATTPEPIIDIRDPIKSDEKESRRRGETR